MTLKEKIIDFKENLKCSLISRSSNGEDFDNKKAFIIDFSEELVLAKEIDDFVVRGFLIFPINHISKLRRNRNDIFYEKICKAEKLIEPNIKNHDIDLSSWKTVFESISKLSFNVIVRNEYSEEDTFDIGPIIKITNKKVDINYFDARGNLDFEITEITWDKITLVEFDDIYINLMTKYLKQNKTQK